MIHTMLFIYGYNKYPKKSVASNGNCVGILSMEHTRTPGPEKLLHWGKREKIKIKSICIKPEQHFNTKKYIQ